MPLSQEPVKVVHTPEQEKYTTACLFFLGIDNVLQIGLRIQLMICPLCQIADSVCGQITNGQWVTCTGRSGNQGFFFFLWFFFLFRSSKKLSALESTYLAHKSNLFDSYIFSTGTAVWSYSYSCTFPACLICLGSYGLC